MTLTSTSAARSITLPARWYHDPAVYAAEQETIFARQWQYVGHVGQFAHPGRYLTSTIAGRPIVVVAREDGLRAFHNVCLHRAGPLVWPGEGTCANFVCRYHAWAYDLDGRLVSARDFGEDSGLDAANFCLYKALVAQWRGLVFANLDLDAVDLVEWLGAFAGACADFPMESYEWHSTTVHHLRADWKTYSDNYAEGYHIPTVHPELNRQIDSKKYRVILEDGGLTARHVAPARDGVPTTGRWLWRYPNLALNLYAAGMNVERFVPVGPGSVDVVFDYFFAPSGLDDAEATIASSAETMAEDARICEAVQRNLEAGVYEAGRLSPRHEGCLAAMQQFVYEAVSPLLADT
jgi:choline monooxygenase